MKSIGEGELRTKKSSGLKYKHSNAILVDATLNCLSLLVRTRQTISNKIISTILNFNPFKNVNDGTSGKEKVFLKSMERTTRLFLMNYYRKYVCVTFGRRRL